MLGQGEQLGPGGDLTGERDDGLPDPVLIQLVQRQVAQPGVLRGPDTVLNAGAATVVRRRRAGQLGGAVGPQ